MNTITSMAVLFAYKQDHSSFISYMITFVGYFFVQQSILCTQVAPGPSKHSLIIVMAGIHVCASCLS